MYRTRSLAELSHEASRLLTGQTIQMRNSMEDPFECVVKNRLDHLSRWVTLTNWAATKRWFICWIS